MNTFEKGYFVGVVSIFGRARDAKGTIIDRDPHGFPTMWITPEAGAIPNRNTMAGSVAKRAGIPIDENGVIPFGEKQGNPDARRTVYGSYTLSSVHEQYGPQYVWNVIKDLSGASIREIKEAMEDCGEPSIFNAGEIQLPEGYVRRSEQHVGRQRMDNRVHQVLSPQSGSNVVGQAINEQGHIPSDTTKNPEVQLHGEVDQQGNPKNIIE